MTTMTAPTTETTTTRRTAKLIYVHLGPNEWGNEVMDRVARETFQHYPDVDIVEVNEHAGWHLAYLRDGTIVGTANDAATLSPKAQAFVRSVSWIEYGGSIRRGELQ